MIIYIYITVKSVNWSFLVTLTTTTQSLPVALPVAVAKYNLHKALARNEKRPIHTFNGNIDVDNHFKL